MAQIVRQGKKRRNINAATAAAAVGPITPGMEVYGLSKGQFSLIELVEHCLAATGPADVTIVCWTVGHRDLVHLHGLVKAERIRSVRWILDASFPNRQPGYCRQLRERFGDECIRVTANHAKFIMVRSDEWNLVIRTSMNLNWNRRMESYEVSDDADLASFLDELVDMVFATPTMAIGGSRMDPEEALVDLCGTMPAAIAPIEYADGPQRGISFGEG